MSVYDEAKAYVERLEAETEANRKRIEALETTTSERIRDLEAQVATLTREREEAREEAKRWYGDFNRLRNKAARVRAATLEEAAQVASANNYPGQPSWWSSDCANEIAARIRSLAAERKGGT